MKFYRGDVKISEEGDAKKGTEISPIAKEILEITGDALLGYYKIPEDPEEAAIYMTQEVFLQTPEYGTGNNRKNGYNVDVAEAIAEKTRQVILKDVEDDAKKPVVVTKIVPQRSWWARFRGKPAKFKVELRYAILSVDGHRVAWSEPFYTEARHGKPELMPLLEDLIRTEVPSVQVNEK